MPIRTLNHVTCNKLTTSATTGTLSSLTTVSHLLVFSHPHCFMSSPTQNCFNYLGPQVAACTKQKLQEDKMLLDCSALSITSTSPKGFSAYFDSGGLFEVMPFYCNADAASQIPFPQIMFNKEVVLCYTTDLLKPFSSSCHPRCMPTCKVNPRPGNSKGRCSGH